MEKQFYTSKKIYDNVTLITGGGGENCYLIEGTERALLIDTLCGIGSLKTYVESLTRLPVSVAITHGHIDHAPGAFEFGECYINPDDIALMYSPMHCNKEGRFGFETMNGTSPATMDDVLDAVPVKTYPIYTGDIFDLGGVQIEVIQVPGHTYGTVVFLDRARRIVYSGDACNLNTLINLPGSTSIEEYEESLQFLSNYRDAFDEMWGGHGLMALPARAVEDGINLCNRIMNREDDKIETPSFGGVAMLALERAENYLPKNGTFCDIVYSEDKIFRSKEKKLIKGSPNIER